jgi:hypothetical protein
MAESLSARLAAYLPEGRTPHGGAQGAVKAAKPRAVDAYVRHAVVAITAGIRKKTPPRRTDAPKAHAIARGVAVLHHGPKLPYYKRTSPHMQTPRGKRYIKRHYGDSGHAAKDAKYYKLVGKRRAEFEGPWRVEGLAARLAALLEGYDASTGRFVFDAGTAAAIARVDARRAAAPTQRWGLAGSTVQDRATFAALGCPVAREGAAWVVTGPAAAVQAAFARARADRAAKTGGAPLALLRL